MKIRQLLNELLPPRLSHYFWRKKALTRSFRKKSFSAIQVEKKRPSILLIHALSLDSRSTTIDYVRAFVSHLKGFDVFTINLLGMFPTKVQSTSFDLVIVTTEALSYRSSPYWKHLEKRIVEVSRRSTKIILFPQDDYTFSSRLDRLCIKAGVSSVYTPFTRDLELLYPKATKRGVKFHEALTGYFDPELFKARAGYIRPFVARQIDIGQRVRKLPPEFGKIGIRKFNIADDFSQFALSQKLVVDFSSDPKDVLLGEKWFEFLGNTKFTISSRGGSSLVDSKNKLARKQFVLGKLFPSMSADKIFKIASLPRVREGRFDVISPRLFEAASMRVCQVLIEDDYLGLEPWVHYIPLKSDLSNKQQIIDFMKITSNVEAIIENAYEFLISSGDFTFAKMIEVFQLTECGIFHNDGQENELFDIDELLGFSNSESFLKDFLSYVYLSDTNNSEAIKLSAGLLPNFEFGYKLLQNGAKSSFPEILESRWASYSCVAGA